MAKIVKMGDVSLYVKPPRCPFLWADNKACRSFGIQINSPICSKAMKISKIVFEYHKEFVVIPREYVITNSGSLYAQVPLYPDAVLISTLSTLKKGLKKVDDNVIRKGISCYNLYLFYADFYDTVLVQIEDLHNDINK